MTNKTVLSCKPFENKYVTINSVDGIKIDFCGDSLCYKPHHSSEQEGYYLRIVYSNGASIMYKFDHVNKKLTGYFYNIGNKYVFTNKKFEKEYNAVQKIKQITPPKSENSSTAWYITIWNIICKIFSWLWNLV
jgi:hypothetical protein